MVQSLSTRSIFSWGLLLSTAVAQQAALPQLNGQHFRISVLEEKGFLDVNEAVIGDETELYYSGYLIDMLEALARPSRANFTYTLLPPSGYGSLCNPQLEPNSTTDDAYNALYRTQYNCGASDVNDVPLLPTSTDMYLGMYYVTPSRQLTNHFTIPFLPPFSGTLAMFGTATGIADFDNLVEQQKQGLQPAACAPGGSALITEVANSFPGIQLKDLYGGEDVITAAFQDGTCEIYIFDGPLAASYVLRRQQEDECMANGKPIGTIGEPMGFGLSHYAIGIRRDIPYETVDALSYWMNILMSCNPLDKEGPCPDGNLATFYEGRGGTGAECGYVLYPTSSAVSNGAIAGMVVGAVVFVILLSAVLHRYKMRRQARRFKKQEALTLAQASRERELNEFIAHEVRNPLASAIAALSFVSSKASDPVVVPNAQERESLLSDVRIIDSSLQFINELLRNMLDLHRTAGKQMVLDLKPTDVLRDILEPVASILFMRGNASVDIQTECPPNLIVQGDRMRLKQVILNLSANSTKFVEHGYVRLRAEIDVNNNVLLHVEDSGPGIPQDKRNRLFAKFQESLDSLNQGTGIGLNVCKNLSELMKADIYLDDNFDSGIAGCPGTRFTLRLNQEPIVMGNGSHRDLEAGDCGGCNGHHNNAELPEDLKVLFVDDDTMIRKMFTRSLARVAPSWNLKEAANGETALRMVDDADQRFDLIFMDQYMASIEKQLLGTECVRLLRAKGVTAVICGLSANDKEEEFRQAGANGFMLKPFPGRKDQLTAELLRLLPPKAEPEAYQPTV